MLQKIDSKTKIKITIFVTMLIVAVGVGSLVMIVLYNTVFEQQSSRLQEIAQSHARIIGAVARFDSVESKDYFGGGKAATMSQISAAHKEFRGFGETGEIVLAERNGDQIMFLLSHRNSGLTITVPLPMSSKLAEPMRRALNGKSGVIEGLDYRGEKVLAAYEPVAALALGVVAKIDISEIHAPFIKAAIISLFFGFGVIGVGILVVFIMRAKMTRLRRESEQFYLSIVEDQTELICRYLPNGIRIFVNEVYRRYHAKPIEALIGHSIYDGLSTEDLEKFKSNNVDLTPENSTVEFEMKFRGPDDEKIWLHWTKRALFDEIGKHVSYQLVATDITNRKKAEEALIASREEAEFANRSKSEFLANMSHELRTPLNTILGFSHLLARDPTTTQDQQKKHDVINRSGTHLLTIINDVLDLSKIDAGATELDVTAFHLTEILEEISIMIGMRAMAKNLSFTPNLAGVRQDYVEGDAGKLRQILINLLGNAVQFTDSGTVILRAQTEVESPDSVRLLLQIEDSGHGISEDKLKSIFEPFVQTGVGLNKNEGIGLGLAITKAFVELMGGTVDVANKQEGGSRFTVELPFATCEANTFATKRLNLPLVKSLAPGQPEWRVLIVDDNFDNRLLLRSQLSRVGFEVCEAKSGEEAVTTFLDWLPHFIFMDIRMPGMDGYETTAKIRSLPNGDKIPIIALTASVFKENEPQILAAGCDGVLHKPYQEHELFSVMAEHLDVEFIYEEPQKPAAPPAQINSEKISKLPPNLVQQMRETVLYCDKSKMQKLIDQIPGEQAELASGLCQLLEKYEWHSLEALLKEQDD